jgi:hypothetical protein
VLLLFFIVLFVFVYVVVQSFNVDVGSFCIIGHLLLCYWLDPFVLLFKSSCVVASFLVLLF